MGRRRGWVIGLFGFGNYVLGAQLLHYCTNGRIDFFDEEIVSAIARFPLKMVLSPGHFVNFADSDEQVNIYPALQYHLAEQFDLPELGRLQSSQIMFRKVIQGTLAWVFASFVMATRGCA